MKYKWTPHNRDIVNGDVIRVKINGTYYYAVATGVGFGCNPDTLFGGGKVFVMFVNKELELVIEVSKNIDKMPDERGTAFHSSMGIEILETKELKNK